MRVLITGSRMWADWPAVDHAIGRARAQSGDHLVVVHGGCPTGADAAADALARGAGIEVEVFEPPRRTAPSGSGCGTRRW